VACWGNNAHGQLGNGNTTNQSRPVYLNPAVLTIDTPLAYTVPISNGRYLATLLSHRCGDPQCDGGGEHAVSVAVAANTQTVYTKAVTISDGALNLIVAGSPAFLSGIQIWPEFAGRALVYAYPLADDGTPETSTGITWTLPVSVPLNSAALQQSTPAHVRVWSWAHARAQLERLGGQLQRRLAQQCGANATGCGPLGRRMTAWPQRNAGRH
jgi:hypothetical protein